MSKGKDVIKVLIADDHAIVRKGLKYVLGNNSGGFMIGEAGHGKQAVQKVRTEDWDVVLLDINMPQLDGLETLKQIKQEKADIKVLMFSMYSEHYCGLRALRGGASGYLNKNCTPEQLLTATFVKRRLSR